MRGLWSATRHTWNGLVAAVRTERAFRQELWLLAAAVPLACVVTGDPWRRVLLIGAILLVMIVELLNTGLEKLADHVSREPHPQIGLVKDFGSAAVGVTLLIAAMVWGLALWQRLFAA